MNFTIDFFELMFLAESVTGGETIARTMAFDDFSDKHYHNMTEPQRKQFFEYVQTQHGFNPEKERHSHFLARFNPNNQFKVEVEYNGLIQWIECYRYRGNFHTAKSRIINKNFIKEVNAK